MSLVMSTRRPTQDRGVVHGSQAYLLNLNNVDAIDPAT
jgi:hypothetical protein